MVYMSLLLQLSGVSIISFMIYEQLQCIHAANYVILINFPIIILLNNVIQGKNYNTSKSYLYMYTVVMWANRKMCDYMYTCIADDT